MTPSERLRLENRARLFVLGSFVNRDAPRLRRYLETLDYTRAARRRAGFQWAVLVALAIVAGAAALLLMVRV